MVSSIFRRMRAAVITAPRTCEVQTVATPTPASKLSRTRPAGLVKATVTP